MRFLGNWGFGILKFLSSLISFFYLVECELSSREVKKNKVENFSCHYQLFQGNG